MGAGMAAMLLISLAGCTGGKETSAETLEAEAAETTQAEAVDARRQIAEIGPTVPLYEGARYSEDFTRRDQVTVRNQFGDHTQVVTLATDDSFPQVWHYYVNYLAQYRAWDPEKPYPPESKDWRSLEVDLTEAMQDPFVPGTNLKATDRKVILQIAETEAEPPTVIRYIITPADAPAPVAAQ